MYQVHDLSSYHDGEVYDISQTNHYIEDGDVLITSSGFAIMYEAWPVRVTGESLILHRLVDGLTFDDVFTNDGKDYRAQANEILTNPDALIARAVDPVAELAEEERAESCAWDQRQQYLLDDA
jgi:hypothetical protein